MSESKKKAFPEIIDNSEYKKANFLIGAKSASSLQENKIIAVALSKIQEGKAVYTNKNGSVVVELSASELRKHLGDKSRNLYSQLEPIAKRMAGRVMGFSNPAEGTFDYMPMISRATYENNTLYIMFNAELKDFIVNLNEKFTLLKLSTMTSFKSIYSFRIYELLRSSTYVNSRYAQMLIGGGYAVEFNLSELKFEIGVADIEDTGTKAYFSNGKIDYDKALEAASVKHYCRWDSFKRSVLDVACKEINEKTDLVVDYEPQVSGRGGKTTGIRFMVYYKKDLEQQKRQNAEAAAGEQTAEQSIQDKNAIDTFFTEAPAQDNSTIDQDALIDEVQSMIEERVTVKEARSLLNAADNDVTKIQKAYELAKDSNTKINSLIPWLIAAIKNEYQAPTQIEPVRKTTPNNFSLAYAHDYDFDNIELNMRNKK